MPHLVAPDMAALKHPDHVSEAPLLGHSAQSPCKRRPKLAAAGISRLQAWADRHAMADPQYNICYY